MTPCTTTNPSVSVFQRSDVSDSLQENRNLGKDGFNAAYVDIESTALVERLLNEVMQTTEAFQKLKNENAVVSQEA